MRIGELAEARRDDSRPHQDRRRVDGAGTQHHGVGADVAFECTSVDVVLDMLLDAVRPGATFGDIGAAIQTHAEGHGMSVVRDFCGHGIGRVFHDSPNVLHYGRKGDGAVLKPGMFFTIEPMINLGRPETKVLADDWTAVTRDKSLSAQCEHTVGVTEDGVEIFTASPKGLFKPL